VLSDLTLPDKLLPMAEESAIIPGLICFAVPETAVMSNVQVAADILTRLRIKGFKISMDDFGTGYSSLKELYRMPFSEVKIDKSFILNALSDQEAWIVARAMIELGHNLGQIVVAEGVESLELLHKLAGAKCDLAQGYFIAKPMNAEQYDSWMKENTKENIFLKWKEEFPLRPEK
ncbi:MAG TPA: EAL domain-containing protein, partial [Gammaproteobacteria bacterium]|nr:EAL domain-containing protein [Gammaproteobacteria bacterium]